MPTQGGNPAAVFRPPAWLPPPVPAALLTGGRQFLLPIADVARGNWTTPTAVQGIYDVGMYDLGVYDSDYLYTQMDEPSPSDVDYAQSSLGPGDAFTVRLQLGAVPIVGPRLLHYRFDKWPAGLPKNMLVELLQGAAVVQAWTHLAISTDWTGADQVITAPIVDFTVPFDVRFTSDPVLPDQYDAAIYDTSYFG